MRGKFIVKSLPSPCQLFDVKMVSCMTRSPIKNNHKTKATRQLTRGIRIDTLYITGQP